MNVADWGIGVVGLGGIAEVHLQAYRDGGLCVVGGCDISAERAEQMRDKWSLPWVTRDAEELIADPRVKVVDVTVPHFFDVRAPILRAAAKHGKPVFLQKPLDSYYENAVKLVQIMDEAGVPLMINQNSLFVPAFRVMHKAVQSEAIGTPYYCQIENRNWFDASSHHIFGRDPRWVISDMAVHHFALTNHWFGPWESVYAMHGRDVSHAKVRGDTWSVVNVIFESGMHACILNNWCYRGHLRRPHEDEEIIVHGERGTITRATSGEVVIATEEAEVRPRYSGRWFPDAFRWSMLHFIEALAEQRPFLCPGRQNLEVVALIEGAYRSAAERREVRRGEVQAA